ncbi:MAG: carboxymuconolactone decarboxylase family protein [Devosia sp.]
MSTENWGEFVNLLNKRMAALREAAPDAMGGFRALAQGAIKAGALDPKMKELIALAIGVSSRCEGCLAYHAKAAAAYGATREEVAEAIGVAVYMGGGPSAIYGSEALAAFDALSVK